MESWKRHICMVGIQLGSDQSTTNGPLPYSDPDDLIVGCCDRKVVAYITCGPLCALVGSDISNQGELLLKTKVTHELGPHMKQWSQTPSRNRTLPHLLSSNWFPPTSFWLVTVENHFLTAPIFTKSKSTMACMFHLDLCPFTCQSVLFMHVRL